MRGRESIKRGISYLEVVQSLLDYLLLVVGTSRHKKSLKLVTRSFTVALLSEEQTTVRHF